MNSSECGPRKVAACSASPITSHPTRQSAPVKFESTLDAVLIIQELSWENGSITTRSKWKFVTQLLNGKD